MASFLGMEEKQRRMYVARLLNLDPYSPESWPLESIDRVIREAEKAADRTAIEVVSRMMGNRP